jgi:hypothetical protein
LTPVATVVIGAWERALPVLAYQGVLLMLKLKHILIAAVAAIFVSSPGLAALTLNNHNATGSIVSTPWLATGKRVTVTTLTNALPQTITVHFTALNRVWNGIDFDCQLSPMETTYFVFESNGSGGAKVTFECSDVSQSNLNIVRTLFIPAANAEREGFIVFHTTLNAGVPVNPASTLSLIADFTVIDFEQGYAFSANGWHFQTQGDTQNNTLAVPNQLASSFIAPDDDVTADLLLYTLHGRIGWNSPVKFGGLAYDDDEQFLSNTHAYDCFTVVSLEEIFGPSIDRRNGPGGFPYFVGHVSLFALVSPLAYNPATGSYGPFKSASVGYMIQTIAQGGDLNDNANLGLHPNFGEVMPANAAWARQMLETNVQTPQCNGLDVTVDPPANCGS